MSPSHGKLAVWYRSLAQLCAAGVPLPEALRETSAPDSRHTAEFAARLQSFGDLDRALAHAPRWMSERERLLLSAAHESGRLSEALTSIADEHEARAQTNRQLLAALIYPLLVLHLAMLMIPAAGLFTQAVDLERTTPVMFSDAGWKALTLIGSFWMGVLLLAVLHHFLPGVIPKLASFLPGCGRYQNLMSRARFAGAFADFLNASVSYADALGGAALVSGTTRLKKKGLALARRIENGEDPGRAVDSVEFLDPDFRAQFKAGHRTGQLVENLRRLESGYRDRAKRTLFQVSFWYPKVIFALVAVIVGIQLASAYAGYLSGVLEMMK